MKISPSILLWVALLVGVSSCAESRAAPTRVLRVCSDPNNLPFSNERGEGFENRLAELIAEEMGAELQYTWWAQRRGFIRNTLRAGDCDLVVGIPTSVELVLPTRPYYRSTYVFVHRKDSGFEIRSFDDPLLKELRVGVHLIGDDYANAPPAHALSKRGIVDNVTGFNIYGDYSHESPPARLLSAVANQEIDVAVAWGPLAGFFANRLDVELELVPVSPQIDLPFLPMVYDISMGVRREDVQFRDEIDRILELHRSTVEQILDDYGVPRTDSPGRGDTP